jgi:TRAP-type mannitol/chloroaromatic compound transport system permease small subunit
LRLLLRFSSTIDALNNHIGRLVYWLILAAVLVSSVNATIRYSFNMSSNAWLELQWYLFSAVFLLCAGYTLLRNEHIRIDIVSGRFSKRTQTWIEIFGSVVFLLPMAIIIMWLSLPVFMDSWNRQEVSTNAGGLIVWPAKLLIPVGFALLTLQGLSELIKRIAFLQGLIPDPAERQPSHGEPPETKAGV